MCMYIIGGVFLLSIRGRNRGSKQASNEGRKEEKRWALLTECVCLYTLSLAIYISMCMPSYKSYVQRNSRGTYLLVLTLVLFF
jgi:hypothetical protein